MPDPRNLPTPNRLIKFLYSIGLGPLVGRMILLLTTTGRRTGLPHVTPLQYEEVDGAYYVGSMRGAKADWFRNLVADPDVEVRVKSEWFRATAEPITDPALIADFLELRISRHPGMTGSILRAEGLPPRPERAQLERYVANKAMAIIRPKEQPSSPRRGGRGDHRSDRENNAVRRKEPENHPSPIRFEPKGARIQTKNAPPSRRGTEH